MTSQTIVSVVLFRDLYVQPVYLSLQMISEFLDMKLLLIVFKH